MRCCGKRTAPAADRTRSGWQGNAEEGLRKRFTNFTARFTDVKAKKN